MVMLNIPVVNVLTTLSWENHIHHKAACKWFSHAECGFVRLSMNHSVVGEPMSFVTALQVLQSCYKLPNHRFLPLEHDFREMTKGFSISGHRQATDAYLLGTAIHLKGRLIIFDTTSKKSSQISLMQKIILYYFL